MTRAGEKLEVGHELPAGRIVTAPGRAWVAFAIVVAVVVITAIYVTRRVFG